MPSPLMRNFKFKVKVFGFQDMGFSAVNGITREVEVIEYREGGERTTTRKFPGQTSVGNVTLERGFTNDSDLIRWMDDSYDSREGDNAPGFGKRTTIIVSVLNPNGETQREFKFRRCFVVSREVGDLDATGNEILIESLEFAHEGYEELFYDDSGNPRQAPARRPGV